MRKRLVKKLSVALLSASMILCSTAWGPVGSDSTKNAFMAEAIADTLTGTSNEYGLKDNVQDGVILHAWQWSFNNIKNNMKKIAESGYSAIQTSVIQQSKESTKGDTNEKWWIFYQPANFTIDNTGNSALGTKAEFSAMCEEAHKYGIKVIVDVVSNHLGNQSSYDLSSAIPSDIRDDSSCWHSTGFEEIGDYNNRYRVTQMSMGGLPDLNTGSTKIQNYVLNYLKECIDAGADGFRFDAAKHIETPDDNPGSQFWPTIINGATEYYAQNGTFKDSMSLYCYGEILNESTVSDITSYTKYMSITENQVGNNIRSAVASGNASGTNISTFYKGESPNKAVLWAESHDTYSNEQKESTYVSDSDINKTWALVGSRNQATALYFARTAGYRGGYIGDICSTQCFNKEVAATNKFHNYFAGQNEYLSSEGNIAYNERGTTGVVLVNCSGTSATVNVTAHMMKDGSYTDQITGNTFTVSGGRITGQIGNTGIAVVYDTEPVITESKNIVYLSLPSGWSEPVYCYAYDEVTGTSNASWPGIAMSKDTDTGYYTYEIPENITTPRVIFYSSDINRTPGDMEPGYLLSSEGSWLYKDGNWAIYTEPETEEPTTEPETEEPTTEPETEEPTTEPETEEPTTKADTPQASSATIEINGYQISSTVEGYRTVYSITDPDNEIIYNNGIASVGLLFGITSNVTADDMVLGTTSSLVSNYNATANGKLDASFSQGTNAQSYSMTMKFSKSAAFYNTTMTVRAYAQLKDGSYIYSDIKSFTIYDVANYLYQNLLMNSLDSHNYLYDNILSIVDSSYTVKDFAWNNSIVKPGDVKLEN